jgi:propane monooxygenase reductase subunit
MSHAVNVLGQRTVQSSRGESLLDTLLRHGIQVRYGCRLGKCGTCKHHVNDGRIDDSRVSAYALLDEERGDGLTLLCQSYPLTDCEVELTGDDAPEDLPVPQSVGARIIGAVPVSRSLWSVELLLDSDLEFLPGQYLEVAVPGANGVTRSYSIASSATSQRVVELVVKRIENGAFSGQLDAGLAGTAISLTGPFGRMCYRPSDRPLLLAGAGSGIGPLMSIIRTLAEEDSLSATVIRLFYGAPSRADLPYMDELSRLSSRLPSLKIHLALSRAEGSDEWDGARGRITPLLAREFGNDPDLDAYVCGPPAMCDDLLFLLEAKGVQRSQIRSDAFFAAI